MKEHQKHYGNMRRSVKNHEEADENGNSTPSRSLVLTRHLKLGGVATGERTRYMWTQIFETPKDFHRSVRNVASNTLLICFDGFEQKEIKKLNFQKGPIGRMKTQFLKRNNNNNNNNNRGSGIKQKNIRAIHPASNEIDQVIINKQICHRGDENKNIINNDDDANDDDNNDDKNNNNNNNNNSFTSFVQPSLYSRRTQSKAQSFLFSPTSSAAGAELNQKMRRLSHKGTFVIRRVSDCISEVTTIQGFDRKSLSNVNVAAGNLQRILLSYAEISVAAPRSYFERNGLEVDEELRVEFVKNLSLARPKADQEDFVSGLADFANGIEWGNETAVTPFIKTSLSKSTDWKLATTVIDTSAEEALGWIWDFCGNERSLLGALNVGKSQREILSDVDSNEQIIYSINDSPNNTESYCISKNVWFERKSDKTLICSWGPLEGDTIITTDIDTSAVMRKDKGVIFLQNIDGFAKVCKITWIQNIVDDKSSRSFLSRFGRTALANQPLFSSLFSNSEAKSKTLAAVDQIHESFR